MPSTSLDKTFSSAGNRRTWTWSAWIKLGNNPTTSQSVFVGYTGSATQLGFSQLGFTSNKFYFSGWSYLWLQTTQVFRDPSAWYHFVVAVDTTQATADDRVKFYVNGSQITDFDTRNNPSQNDELAINAAVEHNLGSRDALDTTDKFDGYMAHVHFIDGTTYDASAFGQTDSTTGIWKPKLSPSVTYGTNGFFLKFASSGSMGTDSSGNGNDFTVGAGNLTQTQDTPSNVFATWNPLDKDSVVTLTNANTTVTSNASGGSTNCTLGMNSGKWYFEVKHTSVASAWVGIVPQNLYRAGTDLFTKNYTTGIYASNPDIYQNGSNSGSLGGGISTNDIMMYAIDMDNNQIYIGKNGNWNDGLSGGFDQSSFSNANAFSFNRYDDFYVVATVNGSGGSGYAHQINFGNGYFGTTAVSSANSDGDGIGLFEYEVPSGYYALCTKNINTYG